MKTPPYPLTRTVDQVDTYHGVPIADPYRWLEDGLNAERTRWIAAQNTATEGYLAKISARRTLRARFEQLLRYPRYYDLYRRGEYLLFKKNDGLGPQLALFAQRGLTGTREVVVNPRAFEAEGTVRLASFALSRDARYLAYGLSEGGSDWQEIRITEMETRQDYGDRVQWVKGPAAAWCGDGFYYSRYPTPASRETALSEPNVRHQVWYHRVGTPQTADTLVYEDLAHPLRLHFVWTTEDEQLVVLTIFDRGAGNPGNAVWVLGVGAHEREFRPVVSSFDHRFSVVGTLDGCLLCLTDHDAPNRRVVLVDPVLSGERHWREVLSEREDLLEQVAAIGGKLFAAYRQDGTHRLLVFDCTGTLEHEIPLPGLGMVRVFAGQSTDHEAFWSFANFLTPPTIYQYDIATRRLATFLRPELPFTSDHYQTTQVFYPAKDGTRIPMFLVHRKDLVLNGRHPSLLYGYGGNGTAMGPAFDPLLLALLEYGVVFAVACLRGGGEYGEAWHRAGRREKKQTVFDDCIAAAEWLQANGYTSRDRAAVMGASNGGLMVGAVMTQRPDLFAVALPAAGVMDMLRFQHFTVGANWTAEYGSSDDPAVFPVLLAYSPLHNLREGVRYPATLATTSEHDDRVVAAHSFKFIATLQAHGAGPGPYLIRIETRSGHGAVSLPKELAERADLYAFLLAHLAGTTDPVPPR